jgi:hypothetical protein
MLLLDRRRARVQLIGKSVEDFKPPTYCIDNLLCLEKGNVLIEYIAKKRIQLQVLRVTQGTIPFGCR